MRMRTTAFSLVVVLVLLSLLVVVVQQNPQPADWTLFGQSFPLAAGVAVASAMLIGFLLAALFVLPFVVPTGSTTTAAETTTQTERDFMDSREQYRQLQAEHSRLQTAYNRLVAERDRMQDQRDQPAAAMPANPSMRPASPLYPMSAPPTTEPASSGAANIMYPANTPDAAPSSTEQPMPPALTNPNGPERERIHVWGVPDRPGAGASASDAVTGTAVPSDTGDPNTFIAEPSLPPDGTTGDELRRQDPPNQQLPALTDDAVPQTDIQAPVSVSSSDVPDRTVPTVTGDANAPLDAGANTTSPPPTDTRADLPPSRQVLRPDGTILGGEDDAPPPPDDSTEYRPSH